MLVKSMLDKEGKSYARFKDNMPGDDWVRSSLSRHEDLTQRITQNIQISRAEVNEDVINNFFDNLEESLEGIPASNIWNYDETNFTDEPGRKRAVVKRGMKYPERAMNSTKASISVMFCGNGVGTMLPPYVVYKSEHLWERWCQGGPRGARFNRTKRGWFDSHTFQDWFKSLFLPAAKKQLGPKVIIGNNLSSHLDKAIIEICESENIRFVFLPPNATHLTQPLDVAYFRPLKSAWRAILSDWKEKSNCTASLPKDEFPKLLKNWESQIQIRSAENMVSGFRACGIIPLDRNMVLSKPPSRRTNDISNQVLNESVMDMLRQRNTTSSAPRRKRARVNVEPGRSVNTDDFKENDVAPRNETEVAGPSAQESIDSDTDRSDESIPVTTSQQDTSELAGVFGVSEDAVSVGNWLLVNFAPEGSRLKAYLGRVESITRRGNRKFEASFLRRKTQRLCDKDLFVFPDEEDVCAFSYQKVIGRVEAPEVLRRGVLKFSVDSHEW